MPAPKSWAKTGAEPNRLATSREVVSADVKVGFEVGLRFCAGWLAGISPRPQTHHKQYIVEARPGSKNALVVAVIGTLLATLPTESKSARAIIVFPQASMDPNCICFGLQGWYLYSLYRYFGAKVHSV